MARQKRKRGAGDAKGSTPAQQAPIKAASKASSAGGDGDGEVYTTGRNASLLNSPKLGKASAVEKDLLGKKAPAARTSGNPNREEEVEAEKDGATAPTTPTPSPAPREQPQRRAQEATEDAKSSEPQSLHQAEAPAVPGEPVNKPAMKNDFGPRQELPRSRLAARKKAYNLIWSREFGVRYLQCMGVSTAVLLAAQSRSATAATSRSSTSSAAAAVGQMRMGADLLLSTLSGSCCALQLFLNLFSTGCAGFNTVIGQYRPFFLSLTTLSQGLAYRNLDPRNHTRAQILSTLAASSLSLGLAFLPELLFWRTNVPVGGAGWSPVGDSLSEKMAHHSPAEAGVEGAAEASAGRPDEDPAKSTHLPVVLKVEGMGCVACVTAIRGAIHSELEKIADEEILCGAPDKTKNGGVLTVEKKALKKKGGRKQAADAAAAGTRIDVDLENGFVRIYDFYCSGILGGKGNRGSGSSTTSSGDDKKRMKARLCDCVAGAGFDAVPA